MAWATCERLAPACAARGCTRPRVGARGSTSRVPGRSVNPQGGRRSRPQPDDLRQPARQATALRASADGRRNERHDRRVSTARFGTLFLWMTSPQTLSTRLHVRRRLAKSTPAGATCARGHSGSNTGSRGHRSQPAPPTPGVELQKLYRDLPIPEYDELLRRATGLVALSQKLDHRSNELRSDAEPRLKAIVEETFGHR